MDTPWPAEFADAQIVTDITASVPADFKSGVFDSAWTAAQGYKGKSWGVPWINDTKFFFYNKKCSPTPASRALPRPGTRSISRREAHQGTRARQVPADASWTQAEAVICDWTEIAARWAAPTSSTPAARRMFNQGGGLAALNFMKQTIDDGLVDPASLGLHRGRRQQTHRRRPRRPWRLNWTYGYNVLNDKTQVHGRRQHQVVPQPGRRQRHHDRRRERRDEHRGHDQVPAPE